MVERTAESAEIQQTFRRTVKRHSHTIQQVDNCGRGLTHVLYGRLVGKKVSAIDGVVEVLPDGVALALQVLGSVNPTLRAD